MRILIKVFFLFYRWNSHTIIERKCYFKYTQFWTSSQDGGVGRYALPPGTTKTRTTTNWKTKNNQNYQKIELYGSLKTKVLKKEYSSRLVGGEERSTGAEGMQQGCGWRTWWVRQWLVDWVVPHLCVDKLGGTTGGQDRPHNPGFQCRETKPQNLWLQELVGIGTARENPSLTEEFVGETYRVLHKSTHPGTSTRRAQFACG